MRPEQWQQIDELFHAALERAPDERAAFLAEACQGDAALQREIATLLAAHEQTGGVWAASASDLAAEWLSDQPPEPTLIGQQIAHYQIESLLGKGGMGEVWRARDTHLNRAVALKVLPPAFAQDADRLRRFEQEARAISALNHHNIITIHEIGQQDDCHFIITELVDGASLRQHLHGARLAAHEVDIAMQVASALAAAHQAGVVHRDIKPENVMLRRDGYVKVLDFGLAKLTEERVGERESGRAGDEVVNSPTLPLPHSPALNLTNPGMLMGTASYMSPEQAQGLAVDARSDIWSLGCVLYEMATGRLAFAGATTSEIIAAILQKEPPAVGGDAPELPAELERIVRKALSKDREARYQTVNDLAADLKSLKKQLEAEASAEHITPVVKRSKQLLFATCAILLFAAAAFAIYQFALKPKPALPHFESVKLARLTSEGNLQNVAVSPDGKYIAYAQLADGKYSLWTKHLVSDSRVQLVAPAEILELVAYSFTPDGGYVFYYQRDEQNPQGTLFKVAVLGGAPQKILTNAPRGIGLSPDGRQLAFGRIRNGAASGQCELWLADADGAHERLLRALDLPEFFNFYGVAWSPDGKLIALDYGGEEGGKYMTVAAVSVADGAVRRITPKRWYQVARIAWLGDGSGLAVVARVAATDELQIWEVSYPAGAARRLTNDLNSYAPNSLTLTANSHTLVALTTEMTGDIWVAPDGDVQRARAVTVAGRYVQNDRCEWTPDGHIIFTSGARGGARLYLMNADGTGQRPLTEAGDNLLGAQVSPEGRYVYFSSLRTKTQQVWRMDMDGSHPKQLTEGAEVAHFSLTPDGGWVLYNRWSPGLWKVAGEGGTPIKLSDALARGAEVSRDGKLLAYTSQDDQTKRNRLHVVRFADGTPCKTFDLPGKAGKCSWSPDSRALVYIDTAGGVSNLWRLPLDGARAAQITDFKSDSIRTFSYSRDGRQLALARHHTTRDVVLISDEQ